MIEGSNCREIIDNVSDMAHFYYVHFAFPTYFKNIFEGHVATQFMESRGRPDVGTGGQYAGEDNLLKSEASYFGPSYMINWLWNDFKGTTVESVLVNCHYPIDKNSFVLQYGVMVKKLPGVDREMANKIAGKFAKSFKVGFEQDVAIWKNKSRIDNPLLCEEDGPVYQLRRWYEQFYVDAADVTEDMVARFEFEIDTSHAVEAWEQEVAENLRRRAERNRPSRGGDRSSERERETAADKRLYLEIGYTPVACAACGVEVAVKKNSRKHTSVQWTRAAVAACPESLPATVCGWAVRA